VLVIFKCFHKDKTQETTTTLQRVPTYYLNIELHLMYVCIRLSLPSAELLAGSHRFYLEKAVALYFPHKNWH